MAGVGEYSAARALRTKGILIQSHGALRGSERKAVDHNGHGTCAAHAAHVPWRIRSTRSSNSFLFAVVVLAFGWPPRAFQDFKRPTRPTTASEQRWMHELRLGTVWRLFELTWLSLSSRTATIIMPKLPAHHERCRRQMCTSTPHWQAYLLGLLAMIKCSICSYQCDN